MASRSKQYYDSHPEARAKKKKYDTKYHATKARRGYRSALNKKRRELGIYGKGGKDVSHTADGGYVLEEPSKNRARQGANRKSTKKAGLGAKLRNRKPGKKYEKVGETDGTVSYRKKTIFGDKTKTYKKRKDGTTGRLTEKEKFRKKDRHGSKGSKRSSSYVATTKTKKYGQTGGTIKSKKRVERKTYKDPYDKKLRKEQGKSSAKNTLGTKGEERSYRIKKYEDSQNIGPIAEDARKKRQQYIKKGKKKDTLTVVGDDGGSSYVEKTTIYKDKVRGGKKKKTSKHFYAKYGSKVKAKSGLAKWFAEDWVDIGSKKKGGGHKKCGRSGKDKDGRPYPKCVPAAKAAKMTASQKKSAVSRKRAAGNPGGKPTNVKTFAQDGLKVETSTNKRGTKKTVYSKRKYKKKPIYETYIDARGNERRIRSGYEAIEEKPKKALIVKEKTNRRGIKKTIVRGAGQLGRTVYKQRVNSVTGKTEYKKSEAGIDFSGGFFTPSGGAIDTGAIRKPQETTLTKVYDAVTRPAQIAMDLGATAFTMWAGEGVSPSSTKASPINLVGTVLKAVKGRSTGYGEEKIISKEVDKLKNRAERIERETLGRIELANINAKNKADAKLAENDAEKKLISDKNTMQTGNIKNVSYEDQLAVVTKYPSEFPGGRQGVIMNNKTTEEMNDDELKDTLALRTINHMNGDENALTEDEKKAYTTKENKRKGYLTPDGKVAHIKLLPKEQRDRWQAKIQAEIEKRKTSDLQTMSQEEYLKKDYLKDTDYKKVDRDTEDFKNWQASYGIPESKWTVGQIVYGNKVVVDIRREKVTEEIKTGVTGRGTRTQGRYTYVFMDLQDVVEQTQDEAFADAKKNGLPFFYFNGKKIKVEDDPDYVDEGQGQRKQQTVTKMSDDLKSVLKYGGKLNKKLNYGKKEKIS